MNNKRDMRKELKELGIALALLVMVPTVFLFIPLLLLFGIKW